MALKEVDSQGSVTQPLQVNGVFPHITVIAKGVGSRTEAGIGALMPWADRLWAVGYVSNIEGQGLGLYEIDEQMTMSRHEASITGTFANRMVHWPSEQAFIGPHSIDAGGRVRTIQGLKKQRLAATIRHLTAPDEKVYFLSMEGRFYEVDVDDLKVKELFNLAEVLGIPSGAQPHFKDGFCVGDRLVVTNNTYDEQEFLGLRSAGRLAEWQGEEWRILEQNPFIGAGGGGGPQYCGPTMYATGWSKSSCILRAYSRGNWSRYLLPKGSQCFDHTWNTEWMRIRHAQTERFLLDLHGMFYELPPFAYSDRIWGVRPVCTHLRLVPDFCYWRGLFVMAGDQTDREEGQPQSGLWFGNIDDLWQMGKPCGWGGPWWEERVDSNVPSDPFLMTGFDKKVLHMSHDSDQKVRFKVEVDVLGAGIWKEYDSFDVGARGYVHHEFPDGFSAHWVRVTVDTGCKATAYFVYS